MISAKLNRSLLLCMAVSALTFGCAPYPPPDQQTPPAFTNSLGMKFVDIPIKGRDFRKHVLFCIHETRVKDFRPFAQEFPNYERFNDARELTPWYDSYARDLGDDYPIINMTPVAAEAFCKWLTTVERKMGIISGGEYYRLPGDHEWSCAVGIGHLESPTRDPWKKRFDYGEVEGLYPWGRAYDPIPQGVENLGGRENMVEFNMTPLNYRDKFVLWSPVCSFKPNSLGLFDMGGNETELCIDDHLWRGTREVAFPEKKYLRRGGRYDTACSAPSDGPPNDTLESRNRFEYSGVGTLRIVLVRGK